MKPNRNAYAGALARILGPTPLLLAILFAQDALAVDVGSNHAMKRGPYKLASGAEVDDVVVIDGRVEIAGRVKGSIFTVHGDVVIANGAEVVGNITVINDDLKLEGNSVVRGSIVVVGGKIERDPGAKVEGSVQTKPDRLSLESTILLEKYLVFERPIPDGATPDEAIDSLLNDRKALWRKYEKRAWSAIEIDGLPSTALPAETAKDARIAVVQMHDYELRIGVAKFADESAASNFWSQFRKTWPEDKTSRAVHSSLCDGAHWFFVHEDGAAALWARDGYLVVVDVVATKKGKGDARMAEFLRDQTVRTVVFEWLQKPKWERHR